MYSFFCVCVCVIENNNDEDDKQIHIYLKKYLFKSTEHIFLINNNTFRIFKWIRMVMAGLNCQR